MRYTALQSDTDCDGTTFSAKRYASEDEARKGADTYSVMTEAEFLASETFKNLDKWEQDYYKRVGYCSLGARWNPWVYDDSIGIPALDHTYDEPIYNDADLEQAAWEAGY